MSKLNDDATRFAQRAEALCRDAAYEIRTVTVEEMVKTGRYLYLEFTNDGVRILLIFDVTKVPPEGISQLIGPIGGCVPKHKGSSTGWADKSAMTRELEGSVNQGKTYLSFAY